MPKDMHPAVVRHWQLLNALADRFGQKPIRFTRQSNVLPYLRDSCGAQTDDELFTMLDELHNYAWLNRYPAFTVAFGGEIPEHAWKDILNRPTT